MVSTVVERPTSTSSALLILAALVIVVAGIRAASSLFVPLLLAAFISLLCVPALFWLRDRGLPVPLALIVVLAGLLGAGAVLGGILGSSINAFTRALPSYDARFAQVVASVSGELAAWGIDLGNSTEEANPFDPQAALGLVGNLASSLGTLLNNAFLLFLTICFILLEASSIPTKIQVAFGGSESVNDRMSVIGDSIRRYLAIKTLTSMATGFLAYALLLVLGVKFAPLWGLVAFLLNFVPAIGSVIAAIPPIALAIIDNSLQTSGLVALGYLSINLSIGNFLEPRVMGREVGISPLVVLMSLVFWGWVLGPVGMVLAVPLTVILKLMLDVQPSTRWLAILLGPPVPAAVLAEERDAEQAAEQASETQPA
ncbi:MAG: AI-2E family transporter [Deltaproteobacteria bacterium]|jgi:predicted PurR-regulated permease PerM|nr:AI-2E family transporter [Deltaproteobacteria bacterium]